MIGKILQSCIWKAALIAEGLIAYNYISGEPVTGLAEGRPMFVRSANDKFNLANFMRTNLLYTL